MRGLICALVYFLISCSPIYSQVSTFQITEANIVGWNLAGFYQIDREEAETFANAISYMDPEVLVLVEVNPDFIAAEIVAELGEIGICYERLILDQSASQNIAFLYKCGVELTNPRFIENSNNNNSGLRKALVANVQVGEFDFILIAVHLKAGRDRSSQEIRDNQADTISNFIQSIVSDSEKDILLVGDYNMIPVRDQSNFNMMNPDNFLNFLSDSLANQFSHISRSGNGGNLLDGFAISRGHTSEYINNSIRVIQLQDILGISLMEYRNLISDHLPIEASFRILEDDD